MSLTILKRCCVLICGLVAIAEISASAADRRQDASRLRIMTFNAEFLWDGVEPEEGRVDFPWKGALNEAEEHMAEIARVIIAVDADIVNLVEVEGLAALEHFNQSHLAGRGYRAYLVKGRDTFTGQDVGLLTRIDPVAETIERYDGRGSSDDIEKSVSKNYYARFEVGDLKFSMIGLHFLARPNSENRRHPRQAQADAITQIAMQLDAAGYPPIVLGDFNDYDGAADSLDHQGSQPITNVLARIRSMSADQAGDDLLNVSSLLPQAARYTALWDRNRNDRAEYPEEFTAIDHILVSRALSDLILSADIPKSHDPLAVSDHYPVVMTLQTVPDGDVGNRPRIASLLPNPTGNERENEEATILNPSTAPLNMTGWRLRDIAGREWVLDSLGVLGPGEEQVILRAGQAMSLNNGGDTVDLVDPNGQIVDTVTYQSTQEGVPVGFRTDTR